MTKILLDDELYINLSVAINVYIGYEQYIMVMVSLLEILFGSDRLQKVRILMLLKGRSLYVSQIARELGIDQPTTTGHLQALEGCGLVVCERLGPLKIYRLTELAEKEVLPCLEKLMRMEHEKGNPI